MQTRQIELYKFEELPEVVQESVIDNNRYMNVFGDDWHEYIINTIKELASLISLEIDQVFFLVFALWGMVNAVTEFVDHEQGNSVNNRVRSAWFGEGERFKNKVFQQAVEIAA